MRLTHLELHGFKSFAKKTNLEFDHPIVAIVGPNGSGKSNVVESFRFVLGEQSMKSMRGKGGADMIFKGSKGVQKGTKASVTIYFNNEDKIFKLLNDNGEPVDLNYETISISREVYPDGLNKYLLNNTEVRLKDINQLLASVHIGASGHHIISQGEADRILNANSRDKKEMIEDALGLKVYQYKIREGERKLERSTENMKEAIMQKRENAPHLNFLRRQMEKIEHTREMKDELALLYGEYLAKESKYLSEESSVLKNEATLQKSKLEVIVNDLNKVIGNESKSESENITKLKGVENKINELRLMRGELERKLGRLEGMIEIEERRGHRESHGTTVAVDREEFEQFRKETNEYLEEAIYMDVVENIIPLLHKIKDIFDRFSRIFETEIDVRDNSEIEKLKESAEEVARELENLDSEKGRYEGEAEILRTNIKDEMEALRVGEREKFALQVKQQEVASALRLVEVKMENLKRIEEDFENERREARAIVGEKVLEYGDFNAPTSVDRTTQEELRKRIERIKIKLEDAGVGNGEEIAKEYNEVSERDAFLTKEIEDLEKSIESTKSLIADLKVRLDVEFREGVEKINKEFDQFFSLMFGGGSGKLSLVEERKSRREKVEPLGDLRSDLEEPDLEDEEVEMEEGIEINVSLPHKKVKELHSLSGGERSLTSIALLFAMSAVNPPPFLILDETDAALDEANSRKYGDMLERLSKHSQLIVVTHNRETMSHAGVLYGVTIGSDGASKLLSVRFDEALAVAK